MRRSGSRAGPRSDHRPAHPIRRASSTALALLLTATVVTGPGYMAAAAAGLPNGLLAQSRLVFSDDFGGTSLDTSKWTANWLGSPAATTPPVNTAETDCYSPSQVSVGGGELNLTAVARTCTVDGKTYDYTSGLVQSDGKFAFTDGFAQARIWTPAGAGLWPAFWLDGQHWPNDGEIDVLEAYGTDVSTFHYHYEGGAPGGGTNIAGATAGWHTYAVYWNATSTTWYYDGKQVYSMATPVNDPMYLVLNLGVNSDAAAVPATMRVSYVKVWQIGQ
jgi:beta-glucanase (GH16 family)